MTDSTEVETREFAANGPSGDEVKVIAERDIVVALKGLAVRRGPWRFRTEDGRTVRPGPAHGVYELDDMPLTTSNPNEPKD